MRMAAEWPHNGRKWSRHKTSKQKQTHIEKTRDMYTRSLRPLPPASLLPPSSSLRVGYPCFLDKKLDPSFLDKKHMLRHTNWTKTCQHLKTHAHTSFLVFAPNRRICLARSLRLALVAQSIRLVLPLEKSRSSPIKCALSSKAVGADGALMREFAGGKPPLGRGNVGQVLVSEMRSESHQDISEVPAGPKLGPRVAPRPEAKPEGNLVPTKRRLRRQRVDHRDPDASFTKTPDRFREAFPAKSP